MTAESVNDQTLEKLRAKGFCFWNCKELGEIIVVVKENLSEYQLDQIAGIEKSLKHRGLVKDALVKYSIEELVIVGDADSVKLVHEAKKFGATIETVGEN